MQSCSAAWISHEYADLSCFWQLLEYEVFDCLHVPHMPKCACSDMGSRLCGGGQRGPVHQSRSGRYYSIRHTALGSMPRDDHHDWQHRLAKCTGARIDVCL